MQTPSVALLLHNKQAFTRFPSWQLSTQTSLALKLLEPKPQYSSFSQSRVMRKSQQADPQLHLNLIQRQPQNPISITSEISNSSKRRSKPSVYVQFCRDEVVKSRYCRLSQPRTVYCCAVILRVQQSRPLSADEQYAYCELLIADNMLTRSGNRLPTFASERTAALATRHLQMRAFAARAINVHISL